MRVLSHSNTHYLSGVYRRVRVPRNLHCTRLADRSLLAWSKKFSTHPKISIWMIRETLRDDSETRIRDEKNPEEWNGMLWLPVNVSSLNRLSFSLFLFTRTLTLWSLLLRRSRLKNSSTNWESRWTTVQLNRRIILPLRVALIQCSVLIINYKSWVVCLLICIPLSLFHNPPHNTRRRSLLMRVLSHSDTLTTSIGIW